MSSPLPVVTNVKLPVLLHIPPSLPQVYMFSHFQIAIKYLLTIIYTHLYPKKAFYCYLAQNMKQSVALFFLIIFSFQIVPAKALGKLISKAQMTEEVKSSCDNNCDDDGDCDNDASKDSKDGKDEKDETTEKYNNLIHQDRALTEHTTIAVNTTNKTTFWTSEDLIHLFTKDIHCPPPNC